jgi:hypothetical protein
MLKASTLFYSVIISLVIAVISGSVILLSSLSTLAFHKSLSAEELETNTVSGLNLLLSKQSVINEGEEKMIDLYGNGNDSVFLSRKFWGAFEVSISKAIRNGQQVLKVAETGFIPDSTDNYCLYIPDMDKPIAVCGNTKLKGTSYLPKVGVKRAYIEGQNYNGSSLVYGEIKNSSRTLPEFNKKLIERVKNLANSEALESVNSSNEGDGDLIKNSFLDPTLVISDKSIIRIQNKYSGNISFVSRTQVIIEAEAELNDVIIFAPKVLIKKGFKGNIQVFATDSIIVQENVVLNYPSVLGIVPGLTTLNGSSIILSNNDTVSGCLFTFNNGILFPSKQSGVSISEKAVVYGRVYTNGFAEIKGTIFGSLMCQNILLRTNSSVYENHFLNATIDRTELTDQFVGINLVEDSPFKGIVKWLK